MSEFEKRAEVTLWDRGKYWDVSSDFWVNKPSLGWASEDEARAFAQELVAHLSKGGWEVILEEDWT